MRNTIISALRAGAATAAIAVGGCVSGAPRCVETTQLQSDFAPVTRASPPDVPRKLDIDSTIHLVLNVPSYSVTLFRGDTVVRSFSVGVGTPRYPTRLGSFRIHSIVWNPWWIPPESDWARKEKKTAPGPANPMGKVKLNYTPFYFLHGTPDSTRLGRSISHGCIRMKNTDAIELALIVQQASGAVLPRDEQDRLLNSWWPTRTVELRPGVPIDVRYEVVVVADSMVFMYRDIYGLEQRPRMSSVLAALGNAGVPAAWIDSSAVREFVQKSRGSGETPVRSLLLVD